MENLKSYHACLWFVVVVQIALVNSGEMTMEPVAASNKKGFNGQCQRQGYYVDMDDPRIYYLCKRRGNSNNYDFETFICSNNMIFDAGQEICVGNRTIDDYQCLKDKLESDAQKICYDETVHALLSDVQTFIDAAASRGTPDRNFHLSVKDIHLNMRKNYAKLIENTGKNIFPLIVATDSDTPELSGVGGAYKVYFRNGTMKRIVPVSSAFELHKSLSHIVLGVFSIVAPYFRAPKSINWHGPLMELKQRVAEALYALPEGGVPDKERDHIKLMLSMTLQYIDRSFNKNEVSPEDFHRFATELAPLIDKSMQIAAKAHVTATIPALKALKAEMGEEEWRKVYVLIPTVWPVSLYNIRLQMFRKVMDFKQIKQQVLITEGARNEDEARVTLGRIVSDRALAVMVFGGRSEESMKDHLFSLSTRRDLLSSTVEDSIGKWCDGQDDWEILRSMDNSDTPRCPMSKKFATMLRQSA